MPPTPGAEDGSSCAGVELAAAGAVAREVAAVQRSSVRVHDMVLRGIADAAAPLPSDERREYDVLAVAEATLDTPGRVRPRLLRLVARLHPLTATQRHPDHRGRPDHGHV